jgi:hypothetical protein
MFGLPFNGVKAPENVGTSILALRAFLAKIFVSFIIVPERIGYILAIYLGVKLLS